MQNTPFCSVLIVTHNSELFLPKALEALYSQTRPPDEIIIVDSGSNNLDYLKAEGPPTPRMEGHHLSIKTKIVIGGKDIGFCAGNNRGFEKLDPRAAYVLFLNPDAFLSPFFIEEALSLLENPTYSTVGALTGTALGYDIVAGQPTGAYDSTGIFPTWYGRWYDRRACEQVNESTSQALEEIPAICGALFFARRQALESVLSQSQVFDERYFMYKEDIDLSLRLRAVGWKLLYVPHLTAYHCRGWKSRKRIDRRWRLLSARNEWRLLKYRPSLVAFGYTTLKYLAVKVFDV